MSLPLLINLIDEACKSGSITIDTKKYLCKKADEFGYSADMVEKMLSAKKINILESEQTQNATESVLSAMNADIRKTFSDYLSKGKQNILIEYFEEKLTGTQDYVLIGYYLKALFENNEYRKAYEQSEKLRENIESNWKQIYPILGQIYIYSKNYNQAFRVYYSLLEDKNTDAQNGLDLLVNNVLNDGKFNLLDKCRKNINYISIAQNKLTEYYENEKYSCFIELFEADFKEDETFVKKYIWSLYKNDGTEQKAYERGKQYLDKVSNSEELYYVMGLICKYLKKWTETYDFFKKCLSMDIDVQEDIDKILDKLIEKQSWKELVYFNDSENFKTKIEQVFALLYEAKDYSNIVGIFDCLFSDTTDCAIIKKYVKALREVNISKSLKKYKEFNSFFGTDDDYWLWLGGTIYEKNNEFEKALELYKKADAIDPEFYADDVKRVNYLLNPDIHFKDLYDESNYADAIEVFESKLKRTTDINLIKSYIFSLYKNDGSEEKGLELGTLYYKSHPDGEMLCRTIGLICKYLKKYEQAKEYFLKAKTAGFDVDEELQEVNMEIAKIEEKERKRKEEEERERKERAERRRIEAEREKEEELERIRQEEIESERRASERRREERERKQREEEEEEREREEIAEKEHIEDNTIGSHHFQSSTIRGGGIIFKEHIYVDDENVRWKEDAVVFPKKISIPIKDITYKMIEPSAIGTTIILRSKGHGSIKGTNFKKSDAEEIIKLIEEAQSNL